MAVVHFLCDPRKHQYGSGNLRQERGCSQSRVCYYDGGHSATLASSVKQASASRERYAAKKCRSQLLQSGPVCNELVRARSRGWILRASATVYETVAICHASMPVPNMSFLAYTWVNSC